MQACHVHGECISSETKLYMCLVAKLCLTLCSPMNCIASVHGISQQEYWSEWVAISSSRGSSWPRNGTWVSCDSYLGGSIVYHWITQEAQTVYESESVILSVMSDSLWPHELVPPSWFLCPWDSPGKNTGVGCHSLLQGIFPSQGANLGLLHYRQFLYHLSHQGSPNCI